MMLIDFRCDLVWFGVIWCEYLLGAAWPTFKRTTWCGRTRMRIDFLGGCFSILVCMSACCRLRIIRKPLTACALIFGLSVCRCCGVCWLRFNWNCIAAFSSQRWGFIYTVGLYVSLIRVFQHVRALLNSSESLLAALTVMKKICDHVELIKNIKISESLKLGFDQYALFSSGSFFFSLQILTFFSADRELTMFSEQANLEATDYQIASLQHGSVKLGLLLELRTRRWHVQNRWLWTFFLLLSPLSEKSPIQSASHAHFLAKQENAQHHLGCPSSRRILFFFFRFFTAEMWLLSSFFLRFSGRVSSTCASMATWPNRPIVRSWFVNSTATPRLTVSCSPRRPEVALPLFEICLSRLIFVSVYVQVWVFRWQAQIALSFVRFQNQPHHGLTIHPKIKLLQSVKPLTATHLPISPKPQEAIEMKLFEDFFSSK